MSQVKLFGGKSNRHKSAAVVSAAPPKTPKNHSPLKTLTIILSILAVLEAGYFTCVYSNIPFIAKWRDIYIETAMDTMRHQWLATAFIPQNVIDHTMSKVEAARESQIGSESTWGQDPSETPAEETPGVVAENPDEEAFYKLFHELDRDSMSAYLQKNPALTANGWDNIYVNQSALDQNGIDVYTTMGEQVLAIDAKNQILLLRVTGEGYRGVLAIAKDPSRLSVKPSANLGGSGQYAGTIAKNNDGILSMTGSGFIDEGGVGNGGTLAGYMMSDGNGKGSHMGWSYKRIELREDDRMYILDAQSSVHPDTTDAVEFTPALIIDGEVMVDSNNGWNGIHPRACIGQSKSGEVMMLVIEGRLVGYSLGTGVQECAKILEEYNCMQAMNLDGGTSAIMWYDGNYVTRCSNTACPEGRLLPNAFVYQSIN